MQEDPATRISSIVFVMSVISYHLDGAQCDVVSLDVYMCRKRAHLINDF